MKDGRKHIIGFSGGLASAVVAEIVAEKYGKDNTVLLFHDTKTEPSDNDRFRREVAEYLSMPITEDSDGRDIWRVFEDEGLLGNGRETPCSRILKRERSRAFLRRNHTTQLFQTTSPATLHIGFTADEYKRAQRTMARYADMPEIEVRFPLIEASISKTECRSRVVNCWDIEPPEMYEWAEHANCVPCVKGGLAYWGLVYRFANRAWIRASNAEDYFGHTIKGEGSLAELLKDCLRLADKRLIKKKAQEEVEALYEYPYDCAT